MSKVTRQSASHEVSTPRTSYQNTDCVGGVWPETGLGAGCLDPKHWILSLERSASV